MTNETKKTLIIVVLSLIIIGLVWFIIAGESKTDIIIESLREQRIQLIRSTEIIESANSRIRIESAGLRENNIQSEENNRKLKSENLEYRRIIDSLRIGSRQTESYISEYGEINRDFADFIQQNKPAE